MSSTKKKSVPKTKDMTPDELRAFIAKKRECDATAQKIVLELLNNRTTEERVFLSYLPRITRSHYEDAVVERAIVKVCGYPTCDRALGERTPAQKYKICTNTNRVYDITERKNFCSNKCYEASNHVRDQIPTEPLWFRKDAPEFSLLPSNTKGSVGEAIDLALTEKITVASNFTSLLEFTEASLDEMTAKENKTPVVEKKEKPKTEKNSVTLIGDVVEKKPIATDPIIEVGRELQKNLRSKTVVPSSVPKKVMNSNCSPVILQIEEALGEWFTFDTLLFLLGESRVRDLVADKSDAVKDYLENASSNSYASYDQYQRLYRKLNLLELEDKKYDDGVLNREALKPLPDYSAVKEESQLVELKVRSFFKGDMTIPKAEERREEDPEDEEWSPQVPLVDKQAQHALRRKVVLNGLDKALPDLLKALGLSAREISGDVRSLVSTFNLQPHNVTFKYVQWNFVAIVVIKLLSVRGLKLKDKLNSETAYKHLQLILLSYELDAGYLDRLVWWLSDIDRLLETDSLKVLK